MFKKQVLVRLCPAGVPPLCSTVWQSSQKRRRWRDERNQSVLQHCDSSVRSQDHGGLQTPQWCPLYCNTHRRKPVYSARNTALQPLWLDQQSSEGLTCRDDRRCRPSRPRFLPQSYSRPPQEMPWTLQPQPCSVWTPAPNCPARPDTRRCKPPAPARKKTSDPSNNVAVE